MKATTFRPLNVQYIDVSLGEKIALNVSKLCKVETIQRTHKKLKKNIILLDIDQEYHLCENVHGKRFERYEEKKRIIDYTKHEIALIIDASLMFDCYANENGLLSYQKMTKKSLLDVCKIFKISL